VSNLYAWRLTRHVNGFVMERLHCMLFGNRRTLNYLSIIRIADIRSIKITLSFSLPHISDFSSYTQIADMDKCVGLVLSSDLVSTDGLEKFNHRLFLTEKSLVCVKLKLMANNEHYADVVYAIAYNKLDVRKSQSHKRCLKLYSKVMKPKKFVVHFQNNYKLNIFADRLVKYMESLESGLLESRK
jgi:hypothetical protein